MGIVNATPDSFHRRHPDPGEAIAHAHRLIADGADIIDVGGESTRPGASPVPEDEELARVIPVLRGLRDAKIPISIDSYKLGVMRAALDEGAGIVNDVTGLRAPGAIELVARSGVSAVLMHMQGEPATMNAAPVYDNVTQEVLDFLSERVDACVAAGIPREHLAVDPGIGFGKTKAQSRALMDGIGVFGRLGCAVLIGISGKLPNDVAEAITAAAKGAQILRVHDVAATRAALAGRV